MNICYVIAEAANGAGGTEGGREVVPIDFIWEQISSLSWLHAIVAISFGVVYLLYGWRIFKVLAVICFGMLGLFLGMWAGGRLNNEMWGGVIGLLVLAFISIPMMKYCIGILGAVAGGTMTGAIWYALNLDQGYIWAGIIVGVVAGGMISFIVFRAAVMLFTSLGGSGLIVAGILALLYQYEIINSGDGGEGTTYIQQLVMEKQWFLPVAILTPTLIGMYAQHRLIKESSSWEI